MRPCTRAMGAVAVLLATLPLSTGSYQLVGEQPRTVVRVSTRPTPPPAPRPATTEYPCSASVDPCPLVD
ncbi:hypothetical protein [Actinokineospora enzanensis]|uniref:hypothetical protein n=1 Tax=Actinokineospora enzanensis TaxID=155975 RepID=UPI00037A36E8|nr:hypothetical protein [Actinokineospora enzanensis]